MTTTTHTHWSDDPPTRNAHAAYFASRENLEETQATWLPLIIQEFKNMDIGDPARQQEDDVRVTVNNFNAYRDSRTLTINTYDIAIEAPLASDPATVRGRVAYSIQGDFMIPFHILIESNQWYKLKFRWETDCDDSGARIYGPIRISGAVTIHMVGGVLTLSNAPKVDYPGQQPTFSGCNGGDGDAMYHLLQGIIDGDIISQFTQKVQDTVHSVLDVPLGSEVFYNDLANEQTGQRKRVSIAFQVFDIHVDAPRGIKLYFAVWTNATWWDPETGSMESASDSTAPSGPLPTNWSTSALNSGTGYFHVSVMKVSPVVFSQVFAMFSLAGFLEGENQFKQDNTTLVFRASMAKSEMSTIVQASEGIVLHQKSLSSSLSCVTESQNANNTNVSELTIFAANITGITETMTLGFNAQPTSFFYARLQDLHFEHGHVSGVLGDLFDVNSAVGNQLLRSHLDTLIRLMDNSLPVIPLKGWLLPMVADVSVTSVATAGSGYIQAIWQCACHGKVNRCKATATCGATSTSSPALGRESTLTAAGTLKYQGGARGRRASDPASSGSPINVIVHQFASGQPCASQTSGSDNFVYVAVDGLCHSFPFPRVAAGANSSTTVVVSPLNSTHVTLSAECDSKCAVHCNVDKVVAQIGICISPKGSSGYTYMVTNRSRCAIDESYLDAPKDLAVATVTAGPSCAAFGQGTI